MNIVRIAIGAMVASSLAACAKADNPEETEAKLKQLTLEATGAAATQSVTVSDFEATGAKRAWTATVPSTPVASSSGARSPGMKLRRSAPYSPLIHT